MTKTIWVRKDLFQLALLAHSLLLGEIRTGTQAGTEAGDSEGHCFPACSHGSWQPASLYSLDLPDLRCTTYGELDLPTSISHQENPQRHAHRQPVPYSASTDLTSFLTLKKNNNKIK